MPKSELLVMKIWRLSVFISILTACSTNDLSPVIKLSNSIIVNQSEVVISSVVNANNQVTSVVFEYGLSDSYGQTVDGVPDKIGGNNDTDVSASISGLSAETKYHYRVKAVSLIGTTLGKDMTFVTTLAGDVLFNSNIQYGSVTDREGNIYRTLKIGGQTWMAENLRSTKFNDGKSIPYVTDNAKWSALTSPAYSWYNNDPETYSYKTVYGALYNSWVVEAGNLCPAGWHIPSEEEWYTLIMYLGGPVAGGKMKETGIIHWQMPNTGATNECGLTVLPGGQRSGDGSFGLINSSGNWWSAYETITDRKWHQTITFDSQYINSSIYPDNYGYSVRCIKDP